MIIAGRSKWANETQSNCWSASQSWRVRCLILVRPAWLSSGPRECSSAAFLRSSFLISSVALLPRELKKMRAEKLSKHKAPNEKKLACLEVAAGPAPGTVIFADPPNDALKVRHFGLPGAQSFESANDVAPPALAPLRFTHHCHQSPHEIECTFFSSIFILVHTVISVTII